MEGLNCPAFAAALSAEREHFNALFAQARRRAPWLDGAEFLQQLQHRIDPLVALVANSHPDSVPTAVNTLYTTSLEMLERGLIGKSDRYPQIDAQWTELMQAVVSQHAAYLSELAAPLTNALYNLTITPRCRPDEWVTRLTTAAPLCEQSSELRFAGQVAAWLSGMAHYRSDALDIARSLPPRVVSSLLGIKDSTDGVLDQIAADRWFHPHNEQATPGLQIVAEAGGFRGLGAEFKRPPTVAAAADGFLVSDGTDTWLLTADGFGATFHRASAKTAGTAPKGPYHITKTGVVHGPNDKQQLNLLADSSSHASTDDTLAVTLPHSHRVFLVGEVPV